MKTILEYGNHHTYTLSISVFLYELVKQIKREEGTECIRTKKVPVETTLPKPNEPNIKRKGLCIIKFTT